MRKLVITVCWVHLLLTLAVRSGLLSGGILPSPPPIAEPGLHVLVVAESDPLAIGKLTPEQRDAVQGTVLQEYVKSKGGQFRLYDPEQPLEFDSQLWRDAMARPRTSLPWLIVSNAPRGGQEGPLTSLDDALAQARRWSE